MGKISHDFCLYFWKQLDFESYFFISYEINVQLIRLTIETPMSSKEKKSSSKSKEKDKKDKSVDKSKLDKSESKKDKKDKKEKKDKSSRSGDKEVLLS